MKYILLAVLLCSQTAFAGGDGDLARIISYREAKDGITFVEFEWMGRKGFIANNLETKLKFEFRRWPESRLSFISKFLSLFTDVWSRYSRQRFNDCLSRIKAHYEAKEIFEFGQMGTVEFRKDPDLPDHIIVPFCEVSKTHSGTEAVFLYAAPI